MYSEINVGGIIQEFRKQKGLSVKELAAKAEISSSMLSQLERGFANPSISTLRAIANVLEVPLFKFFMEETDASELVVYADKRKRLPTYENEGITYELLTPTISGDIEFALLTLEPGCQSSSTPLSHTSEEVAFVQKGELRIHINSNIIDLHEGDSIRIPPNTEHYWENVSSSVSTTIFAITPPTF